MNLLDIGPDLLSLEFGSTRIPLVLEQLGRFGRMSVARYATSDVLTVAGEDFIHQSELDEPCLIAPTAASNALLRFVAAAEYPVRLAS